MALLETANILSTIVRYHGLPDAFRFGNLCRLCHLCLQILARTLARTMRLTCRDRFMRSDVGVEFSLTQWKSCSAPQRKYIGSHVRRLMLDIHMEFVPMLDLHFRQDFEVLEELIICLVDETCTGQQIGRALPRLETLLPTLMSRVVVLNLYFLWPNYNKFMGAQQKLVKICCDAIADLKELLVVCEEQMDWSTFSRLTMTDVQSIAATAYSLVESNLVTEALPHMECLQRLSGRFVLDAGPESLRDTFHSLEMLCPDLKVLGILFESGNVLPILPVLAKCSPSNLRLLIIGLSQDLYACIQVNFVHTTLLQIFDETRENAGMQLFTYQAIPCTGCDLLRVGIPPDLNEVVTREDSMLARMCGFETIPSDCDWHSDHIRMCLARIDNVGASRFSVL